MDGQVKEKLQAIFRVVFHLGDGVDVAAVRRVNQPNWDSLAHVSLVTAIESEFGVRLTIGEALALTSYQATAMLLEAKGL